MASDLHTEIASTYAGRYRGLRSNGLTTFKGIRYARPPLGELRFRAPREVQPWEGIHDAFEFGPVPHQMRISAGLLIPDSAIDLRGPEHEDCLCLNIYTPSMAGRRPVMVYIHGGNFVEGAGSQAWTDPSALARRGDVVVVTINYRLGALGWLFLEELGGSELGADCNAGLRDQIAALQWIAHNVGAFGGDPGNVTLFGYSAGAWSISALLAAGLAPRLFQKAIVMSGGVRCHTRDEATKLTRQILTELGIGEGPTELRRLWELPPQAFATALRAVWDSNSHPFPPIRPVAGAAPIPADPGATLRGGITAGVPIIVGSTLDEFKLVVTLDAQAATLDEEGLLTRFSADPGARDARALIDAYRLGRAARGESTTPTDLYWAIISDQMFSVPGVRVAEAHSSHEPATYMYQVRWAGGDSRLGACHAVDLALMFGTLPLEGMDILSGAGPDAEALADQIQDAWAAFARTGDPSHPRMPAWPRYESHQRATMIFDRTPFVMNGPCADERSAWNGIL
jgi:para-nitrobenzyl esterase